MTLLILAMLILAVDPADVTKTIDRPVLYDAEPDGETEGDDEAPGRSGTA